jgi:membrane-associated phospholipid phosphatase
MKKTFVVILFFASSYCVLAQQTDTLDRGSLKLLPKTEGTDTVTDIAKSSAYHTAEKINIPVYLSLLGTDLKRAFTTPFHMKGSDWATTGKFALAAGALAFFDEPVQRSTSRLMYQHTIMQNISRQVTNLGGPYETYALVGLGAYGFLFKKEKMKTTTLLASQAYITSAAIEKILKFLTDRQRPFVADSNFADIEPTFHGPFYKTSIPGSPNRSNSSFPSGHTTVAFAVATVFAMQYRDKPVIPILAYSAASLVGLSRLAENKHWATDVLTGAALGYLSGRLVVNNFHRFAHQKPAQPRKTSLHFRLGYNEGRATAGLIYIFR